MKHRVQPRREPSYIGGTGQQRSLEPFARSVKGVAIVCRERYFVNNGHPIARSIENQMTPHELLDRFNAFIPTFAAQWNSEQNYHLVDGENYTLHGVCSEFSNYFRDHYVELSDDTLKRLFDFIEAHIVEPTDPETVIDNAICTCFLENLSSEPAGQAAIKWMGPKTRIFFDRWHVGPPY